MGRKEVPHDSKSDLPLNVRHKTDRRQTSQLLTHPYSRENATYTYTYVNLVNPSKYNLRCNKLILYMYYTTGCLISYRFYQLGLIFYHLLEHMHKKFEMN